MKNLKFNLPRQVGLRGNKVVLICLSSLARAVTERESVATAGGGAAGDGRGRGVGWSEEWKGRGEGVIEDKRDRKCNPIPSEKRVIISSKTEGGGERSALGRVTASNRPETKSDFQDNNTPKSQKPREKNTEIICNILKFRKQN